MLRHEDKGHHSSDLGPLPFAYLHAGLVPGRICHWALATSQPCIRSSNISEHSRLRCKLDSLMTSSDACAGWSCHRPNRARTRRQGGFSRNMPLHSYKRDVGRVCSSHNSSHTHGQTLQYDLTKYRVQAKEYGEQGALPLRHRIIDSSLFSKCSKDYTDLVCGIYAHPAEAHVKSFPASVQFPFPSSV